MKKTPLYLVLFFIASLFLGNAQGTSEFETLVTYLEENGNFINSENAPALISPDELKKNLKNDKYLVIDIRSESWFEYGHIKNAKNLKAEDLMTYFETEIDPASYDRIVMICYSGQSASYFASLLRIAGYDNVYSLDWGMSSWREDFAENSWLKNISNDFADKLETTVNPMPENDALPKLETGKTDPAEILKARLQALFEIPYKDYIIKSADIFEAPGNYFIVNYDTADKYELGHIPSAVNLMPRTLTLDNLAKLPTDKRIALYDTTGLGTAYAVAYLSLLGYDVGNVAYGANAFMNDILKDNKWEAFTKKEINMYPVIE
jgi:rhodanese-related sulfurtransferase